MSEIIAGLTILIVILGVQLNLEIIRRRGNIPKYKKILAKADKLLEKGKLNKAKKNYKKILDNLE